MHIGIPNGLENGLFQLGRVLVVGIIASFGTVQIAANAVANNIDSMGCIPGQAISLAMITVVGQCVWVQEIIPKQNIILKTSENIICFYFFY